MRKALVVGINDYPNSPLTGCVSDAQAMASVLGTHGNGERNFEVRLLTSPGDRVDRASLRAAIHELFHGDSEVAVLYFSGHGLLTSTGGYVATTDSRQFDEGVAMDEILKRANDSKALDKVIILDCCNSGMFGSPALGNQLTSQLAEGLSIMTASRPYESALERSGAGVFTSLVCNALGGGAANLCGDITPGSVYAYVDQALGVWGQRPFFKSNVYRFVSLRRVAPPIPITTLRRLTRLFPDPHELLALDPSYEETSSAHTERVAEFRELQKLYSVGLVVPVGAEFMYYAALNSKACKLTSLGQHYWQLARDGKL